MAAETLRQYLDRIESGPGNDSGFVVEVLGENTEMNVSRRYLESEPWRYILDLEIFDYKYPYYNIYGSQTIKFYRRKDQNQI